MERGGLLRWVLIGGAVFLFMTFGMPALCGKADKTARQPITYADAPATERIALVEKWNEQLCELAGPRFTAEATSKGATVKQVWLEGDKYRDPEKNEPMQLVSTTKPWALPLRTNLRAPEGTDQVADNDLSWELVSSADDGTRCVFRYKDAEAELEKTLSTTDKPFEILVTLSVHNLSKENRSHRLSLEQADWRQPKDTQGSFGRQSQWLTKVELHAGEKTKRYDEGDFDAGDFKEEGFSDEQWRTLPGVVSWTAVSTTYFTKALVPVESAAGEPSAETRIEEYWSTKYAAKDQDPNFGHLYRARLRYPVKQLAPGESAKYEALAYIGPKEREVLAGIGGAGGKATDLLDLGMFGFIGKFLIQYLHILYSLVGQWGWAICLLTITVKLLLFPLSITQIKSGMAMRQLKPEMDALNAKYKDNPAQKGLAVQELWRKNKVTNPLLGCLPLVLQMPVWWALYTSLQTAVELYHIPFKPFQAIVPDLSAPGKYFIIPIVLGLSSFLQQHLMPAQGDATQQKLMKYLMPGIFTVFMLFLPAGLGIYFLTNTWLGIGQQLAVERFYKARAAKNAARAQAIEEATASAQQASKPATYGKGKGRVQQRG